MKQQYFEFWDKLKDEEINETNDVSRELIDLLKEKNKTEVLETLIEEIGDLKSEKAKLHADNIKQKKRLDRYLQDEEHSHDEQVTLGIRVEKLENAMFKLFSKRTWLGRLFFK